MQHADRDTRWMLAGGAVLAIAVVCGSLALAGVRLDDRDAAVPAASAGERARQGLAEKVARLRASASALQTAHPEVPQYATIADRAKAYSAAVGGVWRPWPSGAPSGRTNPPVATAAPVGVDGASLVAQLQDVSASALAASSKAPEGDRASYASIALGSRLTAIDASPVLGGRASCGTADPAAAGSSAANGDSVRVAEAARQWLQTDAAQLAPAQRSRQTARIESVARLQSSMLAAGAPDGRAGPAAPPALSGGATLTGRALSALTAQLLLASSKADASGREAVVAYACSLYLTPAERASAGALPGSG